MSDILKFGQDRERRPNPLVERHPGFTASNGDQVEDYLRLVKFKRVDGKNTATSFNVSVSKVPELIEDLQAALDAGPAEPTESE